MNAVGVFVAFGVAFSAKVEPCVPSANPSNLPPPPQPPPPPPPPPLPCAPPNGLNPALHAYLLTLLKVTTDVPPPTGLPPAPSPARPGAAPPSKPPPIATPFAPVVIEGGNATDDGPSFGSVAPAPGPPNNIFFAMPPAAPPPNVFYDPNYGVQKPDDVLQTPVDPPKLFLIPSPSYPPPAPGPSSPVLAKVPSIC